MVTRLVWQGIADLLQQSEAPSGEPLYPEYLDGYRQRASRPGDVAERYHENTKMNTAIYEQMRRSNLRFNSPHLRYISLKMGATYPGSELVELPPPAEIDEDLSRVLLDRRSQRDYRDDGLTAAQLSTILRYGCGATDKRCHDVSGTTVTQTLRAYPSGGALYPVETYLVVLNADDLDQDVYHYDVGNHGLRKRSLLDDGAPDKIHEVFYDPVDEWNTSVLLVFTGAFWRSKVKYGPRGYRYVLQESGHIAQNVLLISEAIDVGAVPLASFHDDELNDLIGVDGLNEAAVYAIALGNQPEAP